MVARLKPTAALDGPQVAVQVEDASATVVLVLPVVLQYRAVMGDVVYVVCKPFCFTIAVP